MSLFDKFKIGLGKSSSGLSDGFKNIFSKKKLDDHVLADFEDLLISADTGIDVAKDLRKDFENFKIDKKLDNPKEILKLMADKMAINVGNPHVIFFLENIENINLSKIGPEIENHELFSERCNVTLAKIINRDLIKVKVWERGAGLTKACGTAACATAVAAFIKKLTKNDINIKFEEGSLNIKIDSDLNIFMRGPVSEIKHTSLEI